MTHVTHDPWVTAHNVFPSLCAHKKPSLTTVA